MTQPSLADWLTLFCSASNEVVRVAPQSINGFFELETVLPRRYGWRFRTIDALSAQITALADEPAGYALYWKDMAGNFEAYSLSSYWRAAELLTGAISDLNEKRLVSGAVQSRSLIEIAATYLVNAHYVLGNVMEFPFEKEPRIFSGELEAYIVKALWGNRLVDDKDPLHVRSVLTAIDKAGKMPGGSGVRSAYDLLCEVAHPNALGYMRYLSHVEAVDEHGEELRVIAPDPVGNTCDPIIESSLWGISWGASAVLSAFTMARTALARIEKHTWGANG